MSSKKTEWMQNWRKNNPIKAAFQAHKDNAKRRGIISELTFEQFKEFAVETDYIAKRGRFAKSMHIDRKCELKGYTVDNIQPLDNSSNVKKYKRFQFNEKGEKDFFVETVRPADTSGAPF